MSLLSVLLSSWQCLACKLYIFHCSESFSPQNCERKMWPYRNRAMLLISHIKGSFEENLIRVGVDTLFVWGHQSELWRFSLCIIDFLLQEEDEHFPTTVTHQARFQRLRGLAFQNTQSGASHLFSALLALNRRWMLKCGSGSENHKSCLRLFLKLYH